VAGQRDDIGMEVPARHKPLAFAQFFMKTLAIVILLYCHAIANVISLAEVPLQPTENLNSQYGNITYLYGKSDLRVIAKRTLRDFWAKYPDCEQQLKAWYKETEDGSRTGPRDIKKEYPSASFLTNNRVVFNIKGNHYRLVVKINYSYKMVWIRFIGTHTQYDKIDASTI
jgi:mRNA interferase HigB